MTSTIRSLLIGLASAAALVAPAQAWWNEDFSTRTRVLLDTTDKGLALPGPLTDVLVPVRLHSGNFDFAAAQPDGADLRVLAADDKTPLPFEVERFDSLNELALIWVRLPAVAQGSDQNLLHVYAGNAEAKAEKGAAVFANGHAAVLHFSDTSGPPRDAVAGTLVGTPVTPEPNGLLAGAVRLAGTAFSLPLGGRLKLQAPGSLTVAMWIKPDAAGENATLVTLGDLSLRRSVDQLELVQGKTRLSGGALPGSAWAHVALTVAGGQATLYVNGQPAGQTELLLPDADVPALVVGEGYKGLIDELQLLPVARDAAWVRLAAASQGADNGFVKTSKQASGEAEGEAGGEAGYMGILLKNLTVDAWAVIIILLIMFVIAAWVMVSKALLVSRIAKANLSFLERFRADLTGSQLKGATDLSGSTLFRLYQMGEAEIGKRQVNGRTAISGASLDAIKATLDATQVRENQVLNARMVLLTIAISGGPFLGLLGTVVGVMITFAAIAAAGDVNVNAIAPGIAAALLATVAGLGVAIPALFGYNWLASQIKNISADMQIFVDEFVTRAAELHGER